jgi:hypothetical protein
MKCDGECNKNNECQGEVKRVFVTGNGFKGAFEFDYCETAVNVDIKNGFTVEYEKPEIAK